MGQKTIILSESQMNRLFEAATDEYSIEKLLKYQGPQRYYAAVKMLGEPFATGSSRCVFDIDDETVLKMAISESEGWHDKYGYHWYDECGCAQNENEYNVFLNAGKSPIVPNVIYVSPDYSMMVCERVMQASEVDFERYLGIPFEREYTQNTSKRTGPDDSIGYDQYFGDSIKKPNEIYRGYSFRDISYYLEEVYVIKDGKVDEDIEKFIKGNWWLSQFKKLTVKTGLSDTDSTYNFGIVKRGDKEMLVVLDAGMNDDTYQAFYELD